MDKKQKQEGKCILCGKQGNLVEDVYLCRKCRPYVLFYRELCNAAGSYPTMEQLIEKILEWSEERNRSKSSL